jgi:CRISPR-associated exonuclease Cas4
MEDLTSRPFRVSDIRQCVYCPRIIYFNYVVPVPRHKTVKMDTGRSLHADFVELEKRRTLAKYHLDSGKREFNVVLECPKLNLTGLLDMLIITDVSLFPVEFKNTTGDMGLHHKYQLAAYAMLVESKWKRPVREGFVYALPGKRVFRVGMDEGVRVHVRRIIGAISNLVERGIMPPRTRAGGRCHDCEFRNYCGDA